MRAEAEELYGQRLGEIEGVTNRIDGGFQRDDGASVKKVSIITRDLIRATSDVLTTSGVRRSAHGDERGFSQPP